jgi:hypothetical protein
MVLAQFDADAVAACQKASRAVGDEEHALEGDDQYERMQVASGSGTRARRSYTGLTDHQVRSRVQSALRKGGGPGAKRWRARWIHWNGKESTVTFEYRE